MGSGIQNPCGLGPCSLPEAGREGCPSGQLPSPSARRLSFLGEAAWKQVPLSRRDNGGSIHSDQDLKKERECQWCDIYKGAHLSDASASLWCKGGHPSPLQGLLPLWAQSQHAGCPRPQVLAVFVKKHFRACYFLSLTPPFFLKKEKNVLLSPLQKYDGNPHGSAPWPFWERSVQLPVYAGPAARLWSGSQGHPNKTWGFPSTYVKRSWKEGLCLHSHRPQGSTGQPRCRPSERALMVLMGSPGSKAHEE